MGGRDVAAAYLVGLGFGTDDVESMKRRISYWTNANDGKGQIGGNALRAIISDRGQLSADDLDVLSADEYQASLDVKSVAA